MAHPDLNTLFDDLLPLAKRFLAEFGEFYPFASSMAPDGKITSRGASTGDDHPKSQELINIFTDAFRQLAAEGSLRAAGICFDVRITPPGQADKSDAIQCALEHESGEAANVYVPYTKQGEGEFMYGQVFASRRAPTFFVRPRPQA